MITGIKKCSGGEQMYLHRGPFRWPCGRIEAIRSALPDSACPGLLRKPLDTAIGRLLAPYRPDGRQGVSNKTTMHNVSTLLAVSMAVEVRRYYTALIAQWRRFMAFIKATKRRHRVSTHSDRHQSDMPTHTLGIYFIVKLLKRA